MMDLTEKKFGRLTILKRMASNKWGKSCWLCRCDCGKEKIIVGNNIKSGITKSCGCLQKEKASIANTLHGHCKSKTYQSWCDIIKRCTNPNSARYLLYGGRGITVCKRWRQFINFLKDMGEMPMGYQIDRIDNNGNYCPSNCQWATRRQQMRNKQDNHLVTHKEKTLCLSEWAEQTGISADIIRWRLKHNWSVGKALTTPIRRKSA